MVSIHHASHPHELDLKHYDRSYVCDGCKQLGIGARFRCEECDFDLHKECAQSNQTTSLDFFQNSTFKFCDRPPRPPFRRYCNACLNPVEGFGYHCEEKDWDLHPICLSLPRTLKADDVTFKLSGNMLPIRCPWCKMRRRKSSRHGWSYVSTCKNYYLHLHCATQMMLQVLERGTNLGNNLEQPIQGLLKMYIQGERKRRNVVMVFVMANVVLELISAVLDQVSSVNRLQFALFGMLISFAAMLTTVLQLTYESQKEKVIWRWRGTLPLPWCYYEDGGRKPFGTFTDIVALVCAFCQCVVATVGYCYLRRHADSPIKISVFPIIFAFGILFSQILKNRNKEKPTHEDDTLV